MKRELVHRTTLLTLVLIISALFLTMIHQFLMAIFMAGLFAAMVSPIHDWLTEKLNGRENLASILTVLSIVLLVLVPLVALITVIVAQAISVGQSVTPWVQGFIDEPTTVTVLLGKMPFYENILPYRDIIIQKIGELVGTLSSFLINSFSSFTKLTMSVVFSSIIMLYVMFYFLTMGDVLLKKILFFLPLDDNDEQRLLNRFYICDQSYNKGNSHYRNDAGDYLRAGICYRLH